jgi:Co/Zn/Cd efflux system component
MGILGALLIVVWAYRLIRDTGKVLLDAEMQTPLVDEIMETLRLAPFSVHVSDMHLWRVGKAKYACILVLLTAQDVAPDYFRDCLATHQELAHITIEIHRIPSEEPSGT